MFEYTTRKMCEMNKQRFNVVFLRIFIGVVASLVLISCEEASEDPRAQYRYNVLIREVQKKGQHFGGQLFYAGTTVALGSCGIIGRRAILERTPHELEGGDWEIVCCWHTKKSMCQEEHNHEDQSMPYEVWLKNPGSRKKAQRERF